MSKDITKYNPLNKLGGLCNGVIGELRGIKWTGLRREQLHEGDLPECIYIRFEGNVHRKHLSSHPLYSDCVQISPRTWEFDGKRAVKIFRTQLPVVLSFATSIHKGILI